MHQSTYVGRVSLTHIRFWLVIQSNHKIGAWLIKDPAHALWESISFHFNQKKNQKTDLLTLTGGQEMWWFKLGQHTDNPLPKAFLPFVLKIWKFS